MLAGSRGDYLHERVSEMDFELFISEVENNLLYGIQGTYQSEWKTPKKRVYISKSMHAKTSLLCERSLILDNKEHRGKAEMVC